MAERKRIATIKLNSGQGGFYDELTNIHLTVANPIAHLYAGQNLTNIRKGVAVGHLNLTEGTLGPDPRPYRLIRVGDHMEIDLSPQLFNKKPKKKTVDVVLKQEPKAEEPAKTEPKKADPVEESKENSFEESLIEEIPAKEASADEKTEAEEPAEKAPTKKSSKKESKKASKG